MTNTKKPSFMRSVPESVYAKTCNIRKNNEQYNQWAPEEIYYELKATGEWDFFTCLGKDKRLKPIPFAKRVGQTKYIKAGNIRRTHEAFKGMSIEEVYNKIMEAGKWKSFNHDGSIKVKKE